MEDKELLMLAAKVADIKPEDGGPVIAYDRGVWIAEDRFWNPLDDDGDALRLGVQLRSRLRVRRDGTVSVHWYDDEGHFAGNVIEAIDSLRNGPTPEAAARRAIVRAAAEIWLARQPASE